MRRLSVNPCAKPPTTAFFCKFREKEDGAGWSLMVLANNRQLKASSFGERIGSRLGKDRRRQSEKRKRKDEHQYPRHHTSAHRYPNPDFLSRPSRIPHIDRRVINALLFPIPRARIQ
uniref:Uncharacterized protein n=1 Tax=Mycena chlorophos TaxID=658473 RepID=A0ABQ0LPR0_MYCCL|nr:predicted protein [Mycena chlorophos]